MNRKNLFIFSVISVASVMSAANVQAQPFGGKHEPFPHDRGGDFRHDDGGWNRGRWINTVHLGKHGWWWVIGDMWYYYPAPVYPYPDPDRITVIPPAPQNPIDIDNARYNSYVIEFRAIDIDSKKAVSELEDLGARVEAFRQTLFDRTYNAVGILEDTENLKKKIEKTIDRIADNGSRDGIRLR